MNLHLQNKSPFRTVGASVASLSLRNVAAGSLLAGLLTFAHPAHAITATWNPASTSGLWVTPGNWSGGTAPGGVTGTTNADIALFNSAGNGNTSITIDSGRNVKTLTFDTSAVSYTIGSAGANAGNSLLLSSTGNITLAATATGTGLTETINAPLVLEPASGTTAGSYSFINNSASTTNTISVAGNVSGGTTTGAGNNGLVTLTLDGTNTGGNTVSGVISNGGAASGVALTKTGVGTWTLTGANTYTGLTTINAGSLIYGSSSVASVTNTLGALTYAAGLDASITSQFGSGNAVLSFTSLTSTAGGALNFVTLGGTGGVGGTNEIKITGASAFVSKNAFFNGADYAYADTGGVLRAPVYGTDAGFSNATTALVSGSHNLVAASISSQPAVAVNSLKFNGGSGSTVNLGLTGTLTMGGSTLGGAILVSGGTSTTISGGSVVVGANGLSYVFRTDTVNDALTINSAITNGGASASTLTKSGAGALTLGGTNTYTGTTFITDGTVNITGTQASGSSTTVSAGTLNLNGASALSGGTLTVNNAASVVTENTTNALSGTAALTQSNGTVTLSQANNYSGATALSGGTLSLGNKSSLGTSAITVSGGSIQASTDLSGVNKIANNFTYTGTGIYNGSNNIEIGGNVTNSAGGRTITNNISGGSALTLDSVFLSEAQATGRVLTINGTGSTTINAIADSAAGVSSTPATSGLTLNSATQTLTLPNADTYSGTTTLTAGTFVLGNKASFGTSSLALGTGTISATTDLSGVNKLTNGGTITGNPTFNGSNNIEIGGALSVTGARTISASTTGGTALTLSGSTLGLSTSATANTLTLSGTGIGVIGAVIQNNGTGGTASSGSVTVSGGSWTLNGTNTYSGATNLNGGTTTVGNNSAFGTGAVTLGNGTLQSNTAVTLTNAFSQGNANSTFGGSNNLTMNGLYTNLGSGTLTINNSALVTFGGGITLRDTGTAQRSLTLNGTGNLAVTSAITNGTSFNGIIALNGSGTTTLSGTNTYSGATTLGTAGGAGPATLLKIGSSTALGFGGISATAGNTTVNTNATLDLNGQSGINEPIVINGTGLGSNGALINSAAGTTAVIADGFASAGFGAAGTGYTDGTYALTFSNTGGGSGAAATATIVGGIVTSVQVTSAGSGYTVNPTLTLPAGAGTPLTAVALTSSASSLTLASNSNIGGAGDVKVVGFVTGGGSLTKVGTGNLILTSPGNNYTGATTITNGALLANNLSGSATGTNTVTVGTLGTLGGTGSISGAVTVNGALAPGDSTAATPATQTGTLSLGSTIAFASGSALNIQIGGPTGGNFDQLSLTSTTGTDITLTGTVTLNLTWVGGSAPLSTDTFEIVNRADSGTYSAFFSNAAEGQTVNFTNNYTGIITYVGGTGNDIVISNIVQVPESQHVALGVMGVLGMIIFMRNRRRNYTTS